MEWYATHAVSLTIMSYWAIWANTLDKDAKLFPFLVASNYHHSQPIGFCSRDGDIHGCESLLTMGGVAAAISRRRRGEKVKQVGGKFGTPN